MVRPSIILWFALTKEKTVVWMFSPHPKSHRHNHTNWHCRGMAAHNKQLFCFSTVSFWGPNSHGFAWPCDAVLPLPHLLPVSYLPVRSTRSWLTMRGADISFEHIRTLSEHYFNYSLSWFKRVRSTKMSVWNIFSDVRQLKEPNIIVLFMLLNHLGLGK